MFIHPGWIQGPGVEPAYIGRAGGTNVNATSTYAGLVPARTETQRYVVAIEWADGVTRTIDSVTIAGVTATSRIAQAVGSETEVAILDALVPAGAAGDVVIDLSGANGIDSGSVSLFTVGLYSYRTGSSDTGTAFQDAELAGIAVNANEYAIGIAAAFENVSGAAAFTWTNLTERDDVDLLDNRVSSASVAIAASGTLTVTASSPFCDEITAVVAIYAP